MVTKVRVNLTRYNAVVQRAEVGFGRYREIGTVGNAALGMQFAEMLKALGHEVLIVDNQDETEQEYNL